MTALESSAPARRREPDRTQDERLFECPSPHDIEDYTNTDPWRLMRIMGEFVQGFEELADITRGVAMFGSARLDPDNPWYQLAVETAKQFGQANWIVLTGAGPGIMEACNKGAREASTLSVGLNIELEALTLIQTGKIKNLPVVLMGRELLGRHHEVAAGHVGQTRYARRRCSLHRPRDGRPQRRGSSRTGVGPARLTCQRAEQLDREPRDERAHAVGHGRSSRADNSHLEPAAPPRRIRHDHPCRSHDKQR